MSQAIAVPLTITPAKQSDFMSRELYRSCSSNKCWSTLGKIIPGLYKITVSLEPQYDEPDELAVIIDAAFG